jgi:hypothetical protein
LSDLPVRATYDIEPERRGRIPSGNGARADCAPCRGERVTRPREKAVAGAETAVDAAPARGNHATLTELVTKA